MVEHFVLVISLGDNGLDNACRSKSTENTYLHVVGMYCCHCTFRLKETRAEVCSLIKMPAKITPSLKYYYRNYGGPSYPAFNCLNTLSTLILQFEKK